MRYLPNGWTQTSLGEIIFFNYGKSLAAAKRKGGDIDVYGSNGVVGQHNEAITGSPAIIVGRKGSFGEVHFSKAECFPIDTTYFVDEFPATEAKFAFALLKHLPLKEMNRATAIPGLNREDAHSLPIQLPPLAEQRRIVKKLDNLSVRTTTARTHLSAIAKLVERYKAAVLDALLPSPDAALEVCLSSTFYGPRFSKDAYVQVGGVPTIRTTDFSDDGTATTDQAPRVEVSEKDLEKWKLKTGDILVTRTGSIGKCALFEDKDAVALPSAYLIRVRVDNSKLLPRFAFLYFVSPSGQRHLGVSTQAVAQPNINANAIRSLPISVVPLDEQLKIVRRIETAFAKIDRLATEAEKALRLSDRLDQRILAQAFAGELVPQDPNDEPASALLEHIREARANAPKKPRKNPTKAKSMKVAPQERVLTDSAEWPEQGLPFEDIAKRLTLPHDELKDAVFALLEGDAPKLRQEFDTDAKIMKLVRVAS